MTQNADLTKSTNLIRNLEQGLSLLEKSMQFRWALLLTSFILAADVTLGAFYHLSLINLDWQFSLGVHSMQTKMPIGSVIVFLGAYMFFLSGISPAIQKIVEFLLCKFYYLTFIYTTVNRLFFAHEYKISFNNMCRYGYVDINKAKKIALQEKDDFWILQIDALKAENQKELAEKRVTSSISFSCACLLVINYFLNNDLSIFKKIVQLVNLQPDIWHGIENFHGALYFIIFIFLTLIVLPWYRWLVRDRYDTEWIHHPVLAEQELIAVTKREKDYRDEENKFKSANKWRNENKPLD